MRIGIKPLLHILCIIISFQAQAQFIEDFNDGDFTNGNEWTGDDAKWIVLDTVLSSNSQISNDTFYLSTPVITLPGLEWRIYMNLQFQTSSNNYVDVYLLSNTANLKATNINGYFVRIGNMQDEISLYRRNGSTITKIIDGIDGRSQPGSTVKLHIKVTWNNAGLFELKDDNTGSGINFVSEGSVVDNTISSGDFFGICIRQSTSSFFNKHLFDNIYIGPIVVDTEPPQLIGAAPVTSSSLDVYFNEPLKQQSAQDINNYVVNNGIGAPDSARLNTSNPSIVRLYFSTSFLSGNTYTLTVAGIEDISGNALTFANTDFNYYIAQPGDVVINELMADPDPPVTLPNAEYIEFYNTSSYTINLGGWKFSDLSSTATLPAFNLAPDSFVILCSNSNASSFAPYGSVISVSSLPSLNNSGDHLFLKNPDGTLIDEVDYKDSWYRSSSKKNGGWSLELIDPFSPCGGASNWIASIDSTGGTPGKLNSVYLTFIDTLSPVVTGSLVAPYDTIVINYNEAVDSILASQVNNYTISNGIGQPQSVIVVSPLYTQVRLITPLPLQVNTSYTVTINSAKDCKGNITANPTVLTIAIPDTIKPLDIIVNEILYNPVSYGFDYVEIYNRSGKILDLKDLILGGISSTGTLTKKNVSTITRLLKPGEFAVMCQDTTWLRQNYFTNDYKTFIKLSSLPSYNDDAGTVLLINNAGKTIDSLSYSDDWTFALIEDKNGVALERVSYHAPTNLIDNWHSAAAIVGFGTPGLKNSMAYNEIEVNNEITLDSKVFSPDQDGYQDLLRINYLFDKPGYTCSIRVFDERGTLIRTLINNLTLSQSGFITWDGIDDNSKRAAVGPYAIFIEVFTTDGTVKQYKKTCVLAGRIRE
jgi:hypothetical protein